MSTFRGLSSTAKQKALFDGLGASRQSVTEFYAAGSNSAGIAKLLSGMKSRSAPVKPKELGVLGHDHLDKCFERIGADMATFKYVKEMGTTEDGIPWVIEVAFGYAEDIGARRLITGLNFSPAINDPFHDLGDGSLGGLLADQWANEDEPVVVFVHLTFPALSYTDRGKGSLILSSGNTHADIGDRIVEAVTKATKAWTKQRKSEDRHATNVERRVQKLARHGQVSTKDAAYSVMEQAWLFASSNGELPATTRQVMYAARPHILNATGAEKLDDNYFNQTLLPDYVRGHGVDSGCSL